MFKKINADAKLPTRATKFSAGVDVYANEDVIIDAGETVVVGLGIVIDIYQLGFKIIEKGKDDSTELINKLNNFKTSHYIALKPRSSLRANGLMSHSAVIDLDYKNEIKMIIYNSNKLDYTIYKGDRIGQMLLMEHKSSLFGIESDEERTGGIGSTGTD